MNLNYGSEYDSFRKEVKDFCKEWKGINFKDQAKIPIAQNHESYGPTLTRSEWQSILIEKGYFARSVPKEYGGFGGESDVIKNRIIASEFASEKIPPAMGGQGIDMLVPTLLELGTEEQKMQYIKPTLHGEMIWCQGYSEPGSGSDLASLQCKAVREGDHYVVNGTKIWTTHAQYANRIFCLVRTDNTGKPQQGITFLLIDMDTPGIEIKPIITMAGDHEVNQTFFDDVKVPVENVVGEENDGWTVAKYLLEFERGGAYAAGLKAQINKIRKIATIEKSDTGESLIDDKNFLKSLNEAEIEVQAVLMTEHRIMSDIAERGHPGPASSILKSRGSELKQHLDGLTVSALGYYTSPQQNEARIPGSNFDVIGPDYSITAFPAYLNNRASTIYGGSNEIQRNIMAKFVLGL